MTHATSTEISPSGVHVKLSPAWSAELSTLLPLILTYAGSATDVYRSPVYVCKEWLAAADSSEYWLGVAASLLNGNDTSRLVATATSPKRFVIDYLSEQLKSTEWDVDRNLVVEYRDNTSDDMTSPEGPHCHNLVGSRAPPCIQRCYASSHFWCRLAQTFPKPPSSLPFLQIQLCTAPRFDQNVRWQLILRSHPSTTVLFVEDFYHAAGILWSHTTRCVSLEDVEAMDTHLVLEWLGRDTSSWAGHYGAKVANISAKYLVHPVPDATVVLNY
ncbi:hypothetical protein SDRG_06664 [Saprolegnia diclina VS20]|uniref:Uncharacterized protein n=1 Tax=Saprolegnia diclina (strain VS20) TaxID=1156394 RepID=T0RTR4_SAPDV|nr:hypothetical protein SDRG_06664 [Saprolegnia diclina VS20]EQC35918.1 hypothetical protein SDRG_06664 [Saprolegnia diclina VS20]|eukprot:XP_008610680.1 hypothetical protein SDRG_06664 [Saprolegnia diclina VS20]